MLQLIYDFISVNTSLISQDHKNKLEKLKTALLIRYIPLTKSFFIQ